MNNYLSKRFISDFVYYTNKIRLDLTHNESRINLMKGLKALGVSNVEQLSSPCEYLELLCKIDVPPQTEGNQPNTTLNRVNKKHLNEDNRRMMGQNEQENPQRTYELILMLTANPKPLTKGLSLRIEHSKVIEKLQFNQDKCRLILENNVDMDTFREKIDRYKPTILHFSGHGEKVDTAVEKLGFYKGGLILDDTYLTKEDASRLFDYFVAQEIPLKLVFLNACHSEELANVIADKVDYVIGTSKAIDDNHAIEFSIGFYFKLIEKFDIQAAFLSGRAACKSGTKPEDFVIYHKNKKLKL